MTTVTRWHLVMDSPSDLRPAAPAREAAEVVRVADPTPELGRMLYTAVGGPWHWVDRLPWGGAEWQAQQGRPGFELWVLQVRGAPAGFYELDRGDDGTTRIVLFGLLPDYIGQGLGGHLLTHAVRRAWEHDTRRVVLDTCSLDHPRAKDAYLARGFRVERTETYQKELPAGGSEK